MATTAKIALMEQLINQLSDLAIEMDVPLITAALVPNEAGVVRFYGSVDLHEHHQPILIKAGQLGAGIFAAAMAIHSGADRAVGVMVSREIEEMTKAIQ